MPLNDRDLDRIGDKVELSVLKAMKEHQEKAHDPLERRVNAMDRRAWWERGILAGILGVFEWVRR